MPGVFATMPAQKSSCLCRAPQHIGACLLSPSFPGFSLANETVHGNIPGQWDSFVWTHKLWGCIRYVLDSIRYVHINQLSLKQFLSTVWELEVIGTSPHRHYACDLPAARWKNCCHRCGLFCELVDFSIQEDLNPFNLLMQI